MPPLPLQIKRPIGWNHNVDPEDVLKAKNLLNRIGHYEMPDFGLTPYPDRALFKGLEGFQKSHGLKVDGLMNPGGPTETTINRSLLAANGNTSSGPEKRPEPGKNLLKTVANSQRPKTDNKTQQSAKMRMNDKHDPYGPQSILEGKDK